MRKYLAFTVLMLVASMGLFAQTTTSLFDSCDISTSPAATLLLPYFEVDPSGLGENTLVTVTNVSDTSIVAHVTVWSNWSYPVLDFNIFLTGYDVQSFSLRTMLTTGGLPSTARNTDISPRGSRSTRSSSWIENSYNTGLDDTGVTSCAVNQGGPTAIPGFLLTAIQSALTGNPFGFGDIDCDQVASETDNYVGYITIDTSHVCSQTLPTSATYYTNEIRYENQLIGDYIRLNDAEGVSGGNPLVHIKAVPGGAPTNVTNLTSSFYQRYQAAFATTDRRQPLPATFAARFIEPGTAAGFDTDFVIWREGVLDGDDTEDCASSGPAAISLNGAMPYVEIVRFDERENPTTTTVGCRVSPCFQDEGVLGETQLVNLSSEIFPPDTTTPTDPAGWMYMNLSHQELIPVPATRASQNWVQVRMTASGVYGVDFDAAYLGNGCAAHLGVTGSGDAQPKIGPRPAQ